MTISNEDYDAMFAEHDGVYDGLNEVETWDRNPYFETDSKYLLEVATVKLIKSTKNAGEWNYILEFNILESSCDSLLQGTKACHIIKCSANADQKAMGPANFKQFLAAVVGRPSTDKNYDWTRLRKAAIVDGVLSGARVKLQTHTIITKGKKKEFTVHTYSHCGE
jgi:hypothetical protein